MKNSSQQLLTNLQAQHNGCTLYALHHILGISDRAVYKLADGKSHMASDTILIACDCLGVDARPWLIRVELDRCKSPQRRQILMKILNDLEPIITRAAVGFVALFGVGLFGAFPL
jgi:plasmid maintenance system antidote protein VapI